MRALLLSQALVVALAAAGAAFLSGCPASQCPAVANGEPFVCEDEDGDGHCAECCGNGCQADCDDEDAWVHPGAPDMYADGLDANCDGYDQTPAEICGNGADDDVDGFVDCGDGDCAAGCADQLVAECRQAPDVIEGQNPGWFDGMTNALSSCGGREKVFQFLPPAAGVIRYTLDTSQYLSVVTECSAPVSSCSLAAPGVEQTTAVSANVPVYLIVEEPSTPGVPFTLTFAYDAFVCGDGNVSPESGESCDDGNDELGDGCDDACQIEPYFEHCGDALELTLGAQLVDTAGGTNLLTGSCGGTGMPERVYHFVPPGNGVLHVALENAETGFLYVRDACTDHLVDWSCDPSAGGSPAVAHLSVQVGHDMFVYVDGVAAEGMSLQLTALFDAQ